MRLRCSVAIVSLQPILRDVVTTAAKRLRFRHRRGNMITPRQLAVYLCGVQAPKIEEYIDSQLRTGRLRHRPRRRREGWLGAPSVVKCRQSLMSWSDYEAQQQRERDDRTAKYKAEQAQREKYEKLRSRCAELLGCAVTSSRLGYAEVALNDLYAIACAVKGQKE